MRQNAGLRQRLNAVISQQGKLRFCTPVGGPLKTLCLLAFFPGRKSIILIRFSKGPWTKKGPLCLFNRNNAKARKNKRRSSFHNSRLWRCTRSLEPVDLSSILPSQMFPSLTRISFLCCNHHEDFFSFYVPICFSLVVLHVYSCMMNAILSILISLLFQELLGDYLTLIVVSMFLFNLYI